MSSLAAITAFLTSAGIALKAYPLWIAFRVSVNLDRLDHEILSAAANGSPRSRVSLLEAQAARLRRIFSLLCPSPTSPEVGNSLHPEDGRGVGKPTGLP
jgi:hypothetical protein